MHFIKPSEWNSLTVSPKTTPSGTSERFCEPSKIKTPGDIAWHHCSKYETPRRFHETTFPKRSIQGYFAKPSQIWKPSFSVLWDHHFSQNIHQENGSDSILHKLPVWEALDYVGSLLMSGNILVGLLLSCMLSAVLTLSAPCTTDCSFQPVPSMTIVLFVVTTLPHQVEL